MLFVFGNGIQQTNIFGAENVLLNFTGDYDRANNNGIKIVNKPNSIQVFRSTKEKCFSTSYL